MKPRKLRRLIKAWDTIRAALGFGLRAGSSMTTDEDRARRMQRAADVLEQPGLTAPDPHVEQLRRDYGVDPDVPR